MRLLVVVLAAGAVAGEPRLEKIVAQAERRSLRKLLTLAGNAELAKLHATARVVRERVLQLDPDQRKARKLLGYTGGRGKWRRPLEVAAEIAKRKDADSRFVKQYRKHLALLEEERLEEIVRVCRKYGEPQEKRRVLLPLLARMPRRADMHEVLGHEKIGDDYVRPGLVKMVRALPRRLAVWRRCAQDPVKVAKSDFSMEVPGIEKQPVFFRMMGDREVASTVGKVVVESAARTQALLELLLDGRTWSPSPVLFLGAAEYKLMVRSLHEEDSAFKLYLKYDNYEHADFYAIRAFGAEAAAERYAHGAGHLTMYGTAVPRKSPRSYAWLREGFGYLVSFELFDRGYISYVSIYASSGKRKFTRPVPAKKTRVACLEWMREQMLKGRAYPLREVLAMSMNSLDFCASMQAYSFVRFLFLYDPATARRLPAALKSEESGPQLKRVDAALRATLNKSLDELARLWRAFVLEVAAGAN